MQITSHRNECLHFVQAQWNVSYRVGREVFWSLFSYGYSYGKKVLRLNLPWRS